LILLLMLPIVTFSQGTVEFTSFYSNSLGANRSLIIYLPLGYDTNDSTGYAVVYFLHGGGFGSYPFIHSILDDLIGSGAIKPIIFVQPDGTGGPYYGSFYANSELFGNFEDYGAYDVVEFIDANYRTITTPQNRSIMGHSWGAYSGMKLALKHPDIFGAVAAHSGTPDLSVGLMLWRTHVLTENIGFPSYTYNPNAGVFSLSMFGWAGAFSPNLNNQPYLVDFPLDGKGDIIDSVMVRWQQHNPTEFASQLSPNTSLTIYFDCGIYDEFECYPMNTAFADSLDVLGVPYEFQSYTGSHFNKLSNRFAISLTFLDSIMTPTSVEFSFLKSVPQDIILYHNYPNPFNSTTKIKYELPAETEVILKIYNTHGQEVKTLVNEYQSAGLQSIIWHGNDNTGNTVSSGIYFFMIQSGDSERSVQMKKMILLK